MNKILVKVIPRLTNIKHLSIIFIALLLFLSLLRSIAKMREANMQVSEAQEKLEKMDEENKELERRLGEVKGDVYLEKQIRDKLGLAKEEEIVVILPSDDILRKLVPDEAEDQESLPDPNWRKWMKVFDL